MVCIKKNIHVSFAFDSSIHAFIQQIVNHRLCIRFCTGHWGALKTQGPAESAVLHEAPFLFSSRATLQYPFLGSPHTSQTVRSSLIGWLQVLCPGPAFPSLFFSPPLTVAVSSLVASLCLSVLTRPSPQFLIPAFHISSKTQSFHSLLVLFPTSPLVPILASALPQSHLSSQLPSQGRLHYPQARALGLNWIPPSSPQAPRRPPEHTSSNPKALYPTSSLGF